MIVHQEVVPAMVTKVDQVSLWSLFDIPPVINTTCNQHHHPPRPLLSFRPSSPVDLSSPLPARSLPEVPQIDIHCGFLDPTKRIVNAPPF